MDKTDNRKEAYCNIQCPFKEVNPMEAGKWIQQVTDSLKSLEEDTSEMKKRLGMTNGNPWYKKLGFIPIIIAILTIAVSTGTIITKVMENSDSIVKVELRTDKKIEDVKTDLTTKLDKMETRQFQTIDTLNSVNVSLRELTTEVKVMAKNLPEN